jgi:pimeloyl-ACP methyl ester carboxylesterase
MSIQPKRSSTVLIALTLLACGGTSSPSSEPPPPPATTDSLPAAGTQTLAKSVTITAAGGSIDDGQGVSISVPAGAMNTGATVQLIEWSQQRSAVQIPTTTQSPKAIDLVVTPGQFAAGGKMTLNLPWSAIGVPTGTVFAAFDASGAPLVLPQTSAFTQAAPQVTIGAAEIALLGGVNATSTTPVSFQIAIVQVPLQQPASPSTARMTTVWTGPRMTPGRPSPHATSAGKLRIAVTVHGVLATVADVGPLTGFLRQKMPKDGSGDSFPFDQVSSFEYDYLDSIEKNGTLLATFIDAHWGDKDKYEVHIFGHSMGGIVARWAVEQVKIPSVTHLVTIGSPSNGVPYQVMQQAVIGFLNAAVLVATIGNIDVAGPILFALAPGPLELVEGSDLLAKLHTGTTPAGVTFQAIGGTNDNLPDAGGLIKFTTDTILILQGRLPCDGFVPLDSAFANLATAKLPVFYNHHDVMLDVATYWPGSDAASWVVGINRAIAKLVIQTANLSLSLQGTQTISVVADDKDGDQLDPDILFDGTLSNPANPPLVWTVDDSSILSLSGQGQLSIAVTGLKAGSATVTVTDPNTGVKDSLLVQVGPGNVLILPPNPKVPVQTPITFTAGLVVGTPAAGTTATWTVTGNGTVNGSNKATTSSLSVDYLSGSVPGVDLIAVQLKDAQGNFLGANSTRITVTLNTAITPSNPVLAPGQQQLFTVSATGGAALPDNATFRWSVSGAGTLSAATTTAPNVTYTAPAPKAPDLLQVDTLVNGSVVATATVPINAGCFNFGRFALTGGAGFTVTVTLVSKDHLQGTPNTTRVQTTTGRGSVSLSDPPFAASSALEVDELDTITDGTGTRTSTGTSWLNLATGPHGGAISVIYGSSAIATNINQELVFNPPAAEAWQDLQVGESVTVTFAGTGFDFTKDPPASASFSGTQTQTFLGRETLPTDAGTFATCKFSQSSSVSADKLLTTYWVIDGYGIQIQSVDTDPSTGDTLSAQEPTAVTVNGVPL